MRVHRDTRRDFFGDIFDLPSGDLNVVKLKRHVPIAWHRHQKQTDQLFCISGRIRVGMLFEYADEDSHAHWFTMGPGEILTIPILAWHGYQSLTKNGLLVQFNSPKWTGEDEERHPIDAEMPWADA